MKNILFLIILMLSATASFSQAYIPGDAGSEVKFTIKNFGLNVTGSFKGLKGKIIFDPANTATASFDVSVDANSVNTGNGSRDKHLKKGDYFDAANHPVLNFTSVKITGAAKPGTFTVEGNLIIKGIKKLISFPFDATAITNGYRLQGQFKINRRDFKVGGGSLTLSDDLTVSLNISAARQ